jgi:hypothetical protein
MISSLIIMVTCLLCVCVQMTPEEEDRRRVWRERNKLAAARCRQRRVDLTNQLLAVWYQFSN